MFPYCDGYATCIRVQSKVGNLAVSWQPRMAPLFAIIEMVIAAAIVFAAANSLRKRRVAAIWWAAIGVATIIGVAVGIWFGFFFDYQPTPRLVVYSFPVPGAFHVLETYGDGTQQWVDFITPTPLLSAIANTLVFPCAMVTIVWLENTLRIGTGV